MGESAKKSEIYKACVQNRVGYVHYKYDVENGVKYVINIIVVIVVVLIVLVFISSSPFLTCSDDVGGYKHYSLSLEHTVLIITQNLNNWNSSNYGSDEKFDKLFNLRLAEGIIGMSG
jgi:hypothetical protein